MKRRVRWSRNTWKRMLLILLLLGHALWILLGQGGKAPLANVFSLASRPSLAVNTWWQARRTARAQRISDLRRAEDEIRGLRAEVDALRLSQARDAARASEADEAARLLGLKQALPLEMKAARVLGNVREAPFGGIFLDRGADVGLVPDQGVLCPEGVVGRVWAVSSTQASVVPLDTHKASTAVMLARSRATGVLQGTGSGHAEMRYVGAQEVVQVGEPVYTSGLDSVFPRGLLVGHVSAVKARDVEMKIEVQLAAPLDKVRLVLLLPPKPVIQLPPAVELPKAPTRGGKS